MRGFALLLVRELRRRLPVHLVSLGLALVALLAPSFVGSASGAHAAEVRGAVAVGLALLWSLTLAFIEGLGFLAGDLREGRLAFDFRLPIASIAIWAGRLVAATASVASAAILILGLTAATGADLAWGMQGLLELVLGNSGLALHSPLVVVSLLLLAVVLALDLVGLAIASRKAWLGVDFASAIVFKGLAFLAILPLWRAGAEPEAGLLLVVAFACGLLALLVATARQVVAGRTEPDRAHRSFSITFATLALLTVLPLSAWSAWYRMPGPGDLIESEVYAAPLTEDLVWTAGPARRRGDLVFPFLLEPKSGRYARLSGRHAGIGREAARVSLDRSRVAWLAIERRTARKWAARVRFADLLRVLEENRESGIEWDGIPFAWALSPDGSHVASVWRNGSDDGSLRLRLEALESGGLMKSLTIQQCGSPGAMVFLDGRTILYGCGWPSTTNSRYLGHGLLIDLESGEVESHGRIPYSDRPIDSAFASAPHRWFAPPAARWSREDGGSGWLHIESEASVEIPPPASLDEKSLVASARFLASRELVVAWIDSKGGVLAFYDEAGALLRAIPSEFRWPALFCESEDALYAGTYLLPPPQRLLDTTLYRISKSAPTLVERVGDLRSLPPSSAASPTTLFLRPDRKVFWLDLSTGKLVPLFAAF